MSDLVLPPIILDLVNNLRDSKNPRPYRENLYNRLYDMKRVTDKAIEDYEREVLKYRKK